MSGYDLNNEGSGFALDNDDSFEDFLASATRAAAEDISNDPDAVEEVAAANEEVAGTTTMQDWDAPAPTADDDWGLVDTPAPAPEASADHWDLDAAADELTEWEPPVAQEPEANAEEWGQVEAVEPTPAPEATFAPEPEPTPESAPEPTPEPEAVTVTSPVTTTPEPAPMPTPHRITIPTEEEQVNEARRVLRVADAYRELSAREQAVVVQFVSQGELAEAPVEAVVVKVLNADRMLQPTMTALLEAHSLEPVERAFYSMGLETEIRHSLGALVAVFTAEDIPTNLTPLDYSRKLVAAISKLGNEEMNLVRATETVLSAGNSE